MTAKKKTVKRPVARRRTGTVQPSAPTLIAPPAPPPPPPIPKARVQIAIENCLSVAIRGCQRVSVADDGATILIEGEG